MSKGRTGLSKMAVAVSIPTATFRRRNKEYKIRSPDLATVGVVLSGRDQQHDRPEFSLNRQHEVYRAAARQDHDLGT
jgi:hypothetical protein